jgi:3-hydroxy-3-methylglutaryl CoA synthase
VAGDTEIQGIRQFESALNEIEKQLPKQVKDAARTIAQDWIAAARNKASRPQAREPAQALTVGNDTEGATIVNSHPLFYGEEFGGQARLETMQFPPHQGQRGYWFFPAARENADEFQKVWEAAIDQATKSWDHRE